MRFFIILLFFFIQTTCFAKTKQVEFIPDWEVGKTYNFKVTKSYELIQKGVTNTKGSASYRAKFIILDEQDDHYFLKLSLNDYLIHNEIGRDSNMNLDSIVFLEQPVNYIYKTTKEGQFIGLENWEEISNKYTSFFNKYATEEIKSDMFEPFINSLKSKSRIENKMIDSHYGLGLSYKLNQPQKITGEISNPFDSNSLNGSMNIELTEVNKNLNSCTLNFRNNVDSEMLSKSTSNFFAKNKTINNFPETFSTVSLQGYYTYNCANFIPLRFNTIEKYIAKVKNIVTLQNIVINVEHLN